MNAAVCLEQSARCFQQLGNSLFWNHPAHLHNDDAVRRNFITVPETRSGIWFFVDPRKIYRVVDQLMPTSGQQVEHRQAAQSILTNTNYLGDWPVDDSGKRALCNWRAARDIASRTRAVIRKENLFYRHEPRKPRIDPEEAG